MKLTEYTFRHGTLKELLAEDIPFTNVEDTDEMLSEHTLRALAKMPASVRGDILEYYDHRYCFSLCLDKYRELTKKEIFELIKSGWIFDNANHKNSQNIYQLKICENKMSQLEALYKAFTKEFNWVILPLILGFPTLLVAQQIVRLIMVIL